MTPGRYLGFGSLLIVWSRAKPDSTYANMKINGEHSSYYKQDFRLIKDDLL